MGASRVVRPNSAEATRVAGRNPEVLIGLHISSFYFELIFWLMNSWMNKDLLKPESLGRELVQIHKF